MSTLLLVCLLFIHDVVLDTRRQRHLSNNINNTQYVALVNSVIVHNDTRPDKVPRPAAWALMPLDPTEDFRTDQHTQHFIFGGINLTKF